MKLFFEYILIFSLALFIGVSFGVNWPNGHSMEPTLGYGDWRVNMISFDPEIGNIIDFYCKEKCGEKKFIQHRLTAIDPNGCMHIEGDNTAEKSLDTRDYGCLMPDDVFIFAKTYPLKTLNPFK